MYVEFADYNSHQNSGCRCGSVAFAPAGPGPKPAGPIEIGGRKVLTLVNNDPPGLRCNNNIQVAAELANAYKVPILVYPVSFMPPGTKAPIVWFGGENIAQSGGKLNGMIFYTELADRFEVEGVAKQDKTGLLLTPKVNSSFEALKQSIKGQ